MSGPEVHVDAAGKRFVETPDGAWKEIDGQGRLFNPNRFSPVTLAGWLRLPASVARDFGIATTIGKSLAEDRTFRRLRGHKDTIAVVIQKAQRQAIIRELGITYRYWRMLVAAWIPCGMAHACNKDNLCLFIRPEVACPYCRQSIESGSDPSPKAEVILPPNGSNPSVFEHESGDAIRDEVGDRSLPSPLPSGLPSQEASSKTAPELENASERMIRRLRREKVAR